MNLRRIPAGVGVVAALVLGGCSDDRPASEPTATTTSSVVTEASTAAPSEVDGITQAEAVAIARERVASADPTFDFEDTFDYVDETAEAFDVSFPQRDPRGTGGEPHVVVDRATGEVTDEYLTR